MYVARIPKRKEEEENEVEEKGRERGIKRKTGR